MNEKLYDAVNQIQEIIEANFYEDREFWAAQAISLHALCKKLQVGEFAPLADHEHTDM